jgi:tetratricopeptide (TPR) repeat protein
MQNNSRLNRVLAFVVFLISTVTYLRTIAPTTSFWDCGEFITSAYTLGIPHPPGAPLFLIVGRIFSMIPFAQDIGLRVNVISALATGLTIMFAYLIIVRLIVLYRGKIQDITDQLIVYGGAVVGSMTLAFTDTFWFNAVEAEVYAISVFFTAYVVWLILVWYEKADEPSSDKYILFIAYLIGLVIGVHLLSILALPVIFLIIYFRKYKKLEMNKFLVFGGVSAMAFFAIYPGIVKWIPNLALILQKSAGPGFTAVFFIFLIALLFFGIKTSITKNRRILFLVLSSLLVILVAVSTYTEIYIRSNLNPDLDENDPETLENMVSYLNREQYGDWSYVDRRAPLWEYQIKKMYVRYFGWQFIGQGKTLGTDGRIVETLSIRGLFMLPFLVGLFGMFHHFKKDWKNASAIMLLFIITGIAIVLYLNQEDPQPRERDYVYTGSFLAFAIWIGIGVSAVLDNIRELTKKMKKTPSLIAIGACALILLIALPINMYSFHYHSHDRTDNYVAYDYSYNILQSCEPNAILFTNGDNDTFPLWFLQYVYGIRKDVRVVNLSLLNTHWYIKQLRDQEPRVPISLNDQQVERLQPMLYEKAKTVRFKVPKEAYKQDMQDALEQKQLLQEIDTEPPEITFELKPTLYDRAIRVQDIMILNIIRQTQFRQPIYFALTVSTDNQINMQKYLRMDGLVYKVVTYTDERISPAHLRNNLLNKFQFRNLNNLDVHYNENIKGLLRNYQGAFFSLSNFYLRENMYKDATEILDKMFTAMPDTVIPMRHELQFQFAYMYYTAKEKEKALNVMDRLMNRYDMPLDEKLKYGSYYTQLFTENADKGVKAIQNLLEENPTYANAVYWLVNYYQRDKQYDKGLEVLDTWMNRNPSDKNAVALKSQLQQLVNKAMPDSVTIDSTKTDSVGN